MSKLESVEQEFSNIPHAQGESDNTTSEEDMNDRSIEELQGSTKGSTLLSFRGINYSHN